MAILSAKDVVDGLVARGVPEHVAQGVAMNFRDESGFNTSINEQNPIAGRGGYGLAQWTGPRRVALEDFARSRGTSADDPNAQLDFFMAENAGPEASAWKNVMASPDARSAAVNFVTKWERPADPGSRVAKYGGADINNLYWDDKGFHYGPLAGGGSTPSQDATWKAYADAKATQATPPPKTASEALASGLKGYTDAGKAPQLPATAPAQFAATGGQMMPLISDTPGDQARRNMLAQMMQQYGIS